MARRLRLKGRGSLQAMPVSFEPPFAQFATEFQALDSLRLAEALDRRLQAEGRRNLRDRLRSEAIFGVCVDELSMRMSGNFEIALEQRATVVRVAHAIFGAGCTPVSHYWPNARRFQMPWEMFSWPVPGVSAGSHTVHRRKACGLDRSCPRPPSWPFMGVGLEEKGSIAKAGASVAPRQPWCASWQVCPRKRS